MLARVRRGGMRTSVRMRASREVHLVRELVGLGFSDAWIAEATGIPQRTINRWRRQGFPTRRRRTPPQQWRPPDEAAYSYVLAMYLGDGHIANVRRGSPFLRIVLDRAYQAIVSECAKALQLLFPDSAVHRYSWNGKGTTVVQLSNPALQLAFPQHGPGRKHERPIELEAWQREITERYAREFLRGMIHSDGSRVMNRFSIRLPSGRVGRYEYPRYFFSNLSADIRGLFCGHCELLGIRWTQSNHRNISVSHRDSVAILDSFVGPKR
jgi:hypothetical protein